MIDPLIFAAYLIVAGVGSVFAVSQIIRIARKGGPHGTRSRAAAERLDLFPPDVELGAVQRADPESLAVSNGHTFAEILRDGDAHVAASHAGTCAKCNAAAERDAKPNTFAELQSLVASHAGTDRRAVIDAYYRGYRNGIAAAEAEFQRVIVSSGERRSAVLRNGVDDV